ncbi:MAG: acetate/propionate family kinase [Bradyrhizobium sp.]|uniref:acetate/propionate family kinase n=1 Tax=Bradyrhizobium sp. TaxID=376 RepID=UPI0025B8DB81|nr:acetate/propionate family kinase [Bradyrhizobium sp.]MBI5264032.1 acetate/propionate family kinase [Bradyrhizobium sp.]
MDTILIVNAGSSSLKFQVYGVAGGALNRLVKGQMDGIGTRPQLRAQGSDQKSAIDRTFAADEVADLPAAMQRAGAWLREAHNVRPAAVGHRVVHGGPAFDRPILVDDSVLTQLEQYTPLAPLHQPNNLAPIRVIRSLFPDTPQVACFDTAFHRGHSAIVDRYAIPERYHAEGVQRYGFHGLSYEFVASRLPEVAPRIAGGRVVVAHLGSGASMCALAAGRSVESSMGFTALDGLPMGTRPGQIDAGVVLYLLGQKGMSGAEIEKLLYYESGLKALSGISNDVRVLENSADPRAGFALDYFAYRVGLEAGRLAAALGGIEGFVFTAGIGENSPAMRARIVRHLAWLGAELDPQANAHGPAISSPGSRVELYVIPTDEELMIARHTLALLATPERWIGAGEGRDGVSRPPNRAIDGHSSPSWSTRSSSTIISS